MSSLKRRIISSLLVVLMILQLIPVQGLAASVTTMSKEAVSDEVQTETVQELQTEEETEIPESGSIEESAEENSEENTEDSLEESSEEISEDSKEEASEDGEETGNIEETESPKDTVEETETAEETKTAEEMIEWPDEPEFPMFNPESDDRLLVDEFYGRPDFDISQQELIELRKMSLKAKIKLDPDLEIKDSQLIGPDVVIYIDGKEYTGGDVSILEKTNFSYNIHWRPSDEVSSGKWSEGSWFRKVLFTVPGLNLKSKIENTPMVINGVKVGEFSLFYDKKSGEMSYQVVFNKYIQMFDPASIIVFLKGSGQFADSDIKANIQVGDLSGNIEIGKRPIKPTEPLVPGGIGWKPVRPPEFNETYYPFGKGAKWNSGENLSGDPQIEWRVVFLEELQKNQRDFIESKENGIEYNFPASNGDLIITDTLDINQQFKYPTTEPEKYGTTPFFFEIPVVIAGTGNIINGNYPYIGYNNYDGQGDINAIVNGNVFKYIDASKANSKDKIDKIQETVKNTPLSWTVTTDPKSRLQTLMINAGKLGTDDSSQGITWQHSSLKPDWIEKNLNDRISNCDNRINEIESGNDSPIKLLDARRAKLYNLLNSAANLTENADKDLLSMIEVWDEDYRIWRNNPNVQPLAPLASQNEDGIWEVIIELPKMENITDLKDIVAKPDGKKLENTEEYQNYVVSLKNIVADQRVYLDNRLNYQAAWREARKKYELTKEFYDQERVYGFILKVRTKSINTSEDKYNNTAEISIEDKSYSASDVATAKFQHGIVGNYNLGEVVIQKADAYYDSDKNMYESHNGLSDTKKVEADHAGLTGATFQVYCSTEKSEEPPELTPENIAFFLDKDASPNGKAYIYMHTGNSDDGMIHMSDLSVNSAFDEHGNLKPGFKSTDNGKLILSGLTEDHSHWLVETEAPKGYYLDKTPIRIDSNEVEVTNVLKPNVSRSVMLYKKDSYSGNMIEGAEFELFKLGENNERIPVTDFTYKKLNNHSTYVRTSGGTDKLKTDTEGKLCIHGLDEGDYILVESNPAPGYVMTESESERSYSFTLSDELPERNADYDEDYHLMLNTSDNPLMNNPGTAILRVHKKNTDNEPLTDAGFAIFHFTGSESDWNNNPDAEEFWEPVEFNKGKYFKTANRLDNVNISQGVGTGRFNEVNAAFSGENGELLITDIPLGHYTITEVKAPDTYIRDFKSFYFRVDDKSVGKEVKLYNNPEHKIIDGPNVIINHKRMANLALVKYDKEIGKPEIDGENVNGGNMYTDNIFTANNKINGLEGAVYKLFMRRGSSTVSGVNPDPDQLNTNKILEDKQDYDNCLAVGTTDKNGILRLNEMRDINGKLMAGLHTGNYYMIEVKAPEGYLPDPKPVIFKINSAVYPQNMKKPAGLVMAAANTKVNYGIKLLKLDKEKNADNKYYIRLEGAEFTVKEGSTELHFTESNGKYFLAKNNTDGAVSRVKTREDGWLDVSGLEAGKTYTFTEVKAPRGYELLKDPIKISTPANPNEGNIEGNTVYSAIPQIVENERLKAKAVIKKKSSDTAELLKGAEFGLYNLVLETIPEDDPDYNPQTPNAARLEEKLIDTKITDENGEAVFDNLEWYKNYFIKEIKAPEGYMLDETRYSFTVDKYSFGEDGTVIPLTFVIYNNKGNLGEAKLIKVDAADHDIRLKGAQFYLEKKQIANNSGKPYWVSYGRGLYTTDKNGEILFRLPAGDYRLTEMKAPDGYIVEFFKPLHFTIVKSDGASDSKQVLIDEENSNDGVIENQKGQSGIRISKTITDSNLPVSGVSFNVGWQYRDIESNEITYEPLYFIPEGKNNYLYTEDKTAIGATKDIVTGKDGVAYAMIPHNLKPEDNGKAARLCAWETAVPEGIVLDTKPNYFNLLNGISVEVKVSDMLKQEILEKLAINILKLDGESKKPLSGAEFNLYYYDEKAADIEDAGILVGKGMTGKDGRLVFNKETVKSEPGLKPGGSYYIVETKAPKGYVLDQTHYEVILDDKYFDKDYNFIENEITLHNYRTKGSVALRKVDKDDPDKKLYGAEFELMHFETESSVWEHYGDLRYTTDENGILKIEDLPYGKYKLIERAAPLGYILDEKEPEFIFDIEDNGKHIDLGNVLNKAFSGTVSDVIVKKADKNNPDTALKDAHFQLYELGADGGYHLRHERIYVTDEKGTFAIKNLPSGSYALKEIKAPDGYELPDQPMTLFAVNESDKLVEIQIKNVKEGQGGGTTGGGGKPTIPTHPGGGGGGGSSIIVYPNRPIDSNPQGPGIIVESNAGMEEISPSEEIVPVETGISLDQKTENEHRHKNRLNTNRRSPKTADETNLMFWISIMLISLTGAIILIFNFEFKKKKKT